ncbi:MAG: site-specific integrase [Firmicutes bacterium]|nr:site-specific integrase [Bacillota bacterium]
MGSGRSQELPGRPADPPARFRRRTLAPGPDQTETGSGILGEAYEEQGLIITNGNGGPLDPRGVDRAFRRIANAAGFPKFRFHDLRHTHATLLLMQGVHPKVVQERLGHASIRMTLDTYSHVLRGIQEAAAEKLNELKDRARRPMDDRDDDGGCFFKH